MSLTLYILLVVILSIIGIAMISWMIFDFRVQYRIWKENMKKLKKENDERD